MIKIEQFAAFTTDHQGTEIPCTVVGVDQRNGNDVLIVLINDGGQIWAKAVDTVEEVADD